MYVNARAIIERQVGGETEILFQVRDRPGEPRALELPGGQVEESRQGDGAYGHRWLSDAEVGRRFGAEPEQFDWLTQAALEHYITWRQAAER